MEEEIKEKYHCHHHLEDLAQIIHNQTLILETLANALVNKRPQEQTMNDKLTAFLRTKPPTHYKKSEYQ